MRYSILASRMGVGNIMWMSWNVNTKKKSLIGMGTQFLQLSGDGAFAMLEAMQRNEMPPGHIDAVFKEWFTAGGPDFQRHLGFSYLFPPMGNFAEHASGCDVSHDRPGNPTRPSRWDEPWVCVGSRPSHDPKHRTKYLAQLQRKGGALWLGEVDVGDENPPRPLRWLTCWTGYGARPGSTKPPPAPPTHSELAYTFPD